MSERRHDEELGRATRFLFDSDHMLAEVKKFGEGKQTPLDCIGFNVNF